LESFSPLRWLFRLRALSALQKGNGIADGFVTCRRHCTAPCRLSAVSGFGSVWVAFVSTFNGTLACVDVLNVSIILIF